MNLNFDAFTYITGIASLLGLLLQFKDSFPSHRETRKTIVVLVMGIFVGSVIASLKGDKVEFGATVTHVHVLEGIFISVFAIAAIAAAFTKDIHSRSQLSFFIGLGVYALFMLILSSREAEQRHMKEQISLEELLTLSDLAVSRLNFERALLLLEEAKKILPLPDERLKSLEQREADIKAKQVSGK